MRALPVDLGASKDALLSGLNDGTLRPDGPRALEWTTAPKTEPRCWMQSSIRLLSSIGMKTRGIDCRHSCGEVGEARRRFQGEAEAVRRLEAAVASGMASAIIVEFRRLREQSRLQFC